jgi:hypothetical protein
MAAKAGVTFCVAIYQLEEFDAGHWDGVISN